MNCEEVDEFIGAYAIDALEQHEGLAVREHLRGCNLHAIEARELRSAVAHIEAMAEPTTPPPALRARVLEAVRVSHTRPRPVPIREPRPHKRSYRRWYPIAAAVVASAAIVGLVAWNVVLLGRSGQTDVGQLVSRARVVATLQPQGAAGSGIVLYFPDEKKALVVGEGMRQLDPSTSTYQLWELDGGSARSLGFMQVDRTGHVATVVAFDGGRGQTLAITVEPAGGSRQPTTQPVFSTGL